LSLPSPDEIHQIKEIEQEKLILEEFLEILSNKDSISQEIFDSMSHELRTPIVSIKAYTDMLLEGRFGKIDKIQHEKLNYIKTNTNLLLDIVFKMLEKSKLR
jgi:signal transduction histidine kinase